jgi:hypothetical protein
MYVRKVVYICTNTFVKSNADTVRTRASYVHNASGCVQRHQNPKYVMPEAIDTTE